jgi:hypothetical protein
MACDSNTGMGKKFFSSPGRPDLLPFKWYCGSFVGVKRPLGQVEHIRLSAEIKNVWSYYLQFFTTWRGKALLLSESYAIIS